MTALLVHPLLPLVASRLSGISAGSPRHRLRLAARLISFCLRGLVLSCLSTCQSFHSLELRASGSESTKPSDSIQNVFWLQAPGGVSALSQENAYSEVRHSNWTICSPLSQFCSEIFPILSLSYWGAHSYYPRGLIVRNGNSPNSQY